MASVSEVKAQPASGLRHIDAVLSSGPGWNWLAPARQVIHYTFALDGHDRSLVGAELSTAPVAFNTAQQAAAVAALQLISTITGIRFEQVASGAQADLHFAAADIAASSTAGLCKWRNEFTYDSRNTVTAYSIEAYVYLDNGNFVERTRNPVAGSEGYELLLHELGHALGLKHPFEGSVRLPPAEDRTSNTLMSYTEVGGPYSVYAPYDVAALTFLYGGDGLGGRLGVGAPGRYLVGTSGDDTLAGGSADDRFEGRGGRDRIDGDAGVDLARFEGPRADFGLARVAGTVSVSGAAGSAQLAGVERLAFDDGHVALDLDAAAGVVARILGAVFGREAVHERTYVGIGLHHADGGWSAEQLVALALQARLGDAPGPVQVVELLYTHVAGRPPPAAERDAFVAQLNSGAYSVEGLALMAAYHPLNEAGIELPTLVAQGLDYLPFGG